MKLLDLLRNENLTKADKLILIYLNKIKINEISTVSYMKMSKDLSTSKQTIISSIKSLEKLNLLEIEGVPNKDKGKLSNRYKLTGGNLDD